MWATAWLQMGRLTEIQRATRDHFLEGGSLVAVLLVVIVLVAALTLAYCLSQRDRSGAKRDKGGNPHRLLQDLIAALDMTAAQRRLVQAIARRAGLKHPAVILMSEALFDRAAAAYSEATVNDESSCAGQIDVVRGMLFPKSTGAPAGDSNAARPADSFPPTD